MQRNFFSLIVTCLGVSLGAVFQSVAYAIPADQDAVVEAVHTVADLPVSVPLPAQQQAGVDSSDGQGTTGVPVADTVTMDRKASMHPGAPVSIPCMQGFADEPADAATGCDAASAGLQPLSFQMGRRIGVNSGIIDNYDGIRVDYRFSQGLNLNAVAGYQDISVQGPDAARMLGVSADTGSFAGAWDMNGFYLQQHNEAGAISRVIGGALRYLRPRRSVLVFADYDVGADALGALTISGAWAPHAGTTLSTTFDLRNSPVQKRQQAYLQQTMAATAGWHWSLPTERIRHFAGDRSEAVRTLAFGLSHAFSGSLKLTGSVAVLDVEAETTADAAPASEYFYNLKLAGTDLMLAGDSGALDLHHSVTESARRSSASINTRYAVSRAWNISPRLRADYRNNDVERSVRLVTSPALLMEYRGNNYYGFQIEAGGEWSSEQTPARDRNRSSYFVSLGYKAKF